MVSRANIRQLNVNRHDGRVLIILGFSRRVMVVNIYSRAYVIHSPSRLLGSTACLFRPQLGAYFLGCRFDQ